MIAISGKQNDDEVETSIVHLMQRYIAEVKIFFPIWPALPGTLLGGPIRHLQCFFFKCTTALFRNNLEIKLFVVFNFIMTFLHMCEILECIVGFYPIVFYLAHIVALYTFIVLLSYLMFVIYISVPVAHFVEGDKI